ncbi:MAG: palindromic element RPE4 domain-containing protein [Rickettsia aeschlimannii]
MHGPVKPTCVTPWLDHGIQFINTKIISIFYCFLDPVVKPRGDTGEI